MTNLSASRSVLTKFSLVAASTFGLFAATAARADVPPPDSTQCTGKAAGDACTTDSGAEGSCTTSTCSKLDYSQGTPPKSVEYECTLCVERGATDGGTDATGTDGTDIPGTDGGTDATGTDGGTDIPGTDGGTDLPGTDGSTDVPATDGGGTDGAAGAPVTPTAGGDTKDSTSSSSSKSSGCSAAQVAGGVGPTALALLGAYLLARRRSGAKR